MCLVVEKAIADRCSNLVLGSRSQRALKVLQWLVVFHCVTLLWVVFRCSNFSQCVAYLAGLMKGTFDVQPTYLVALAASSVLLFGLDFVHRSTASDTSLSRWPFWPRSVACAAMVCLVITLWPSKYAPFLYFQF